MKKFTNVALGALLLAALRLRSKPVPVLAGLSA
jgi:hypothetical protein